MLSTLPSAAAFAIRALGTLNRTEFRGLEHLDAAVLEHDHALIALWHETMIIAAYCHRDSGYHSMTSLSFDGDLAMRVCEHLGLHTVRGSSSRGGGAALDELTHASSLTRLAGLTVDGPRGPRREVKAGLVILSARTGYPLVPCAMATNRGRRLRSWDRCMLPFPLGRFVCAYGPPITAPANTPESIETTRQELEAALREQQESLEVELGLDS